MENMIPLNGRIAIVDDDEKQAMPLMRVFSRMNIPYTFYKGNDYRFLPETPENDIRILFLDLNLLGNRVEEEKNIRSILIPTISHIISPQNYPYILILWSRQENQYRSVLENIFQEELKECAPIAIKNYVKSDFFDSYGTEENEALDNTIIVDTLKSILAEFPAYSYLMQWENLAHTSTDELLKEIFSNTEPNKWGNIANVIINSLGRAYIGQHFSDATSEEKIKASLFALNSVYTDFLDNNLTDCFISCAKDLDEESLDREFIEVLKADLNRKMHVFTGPRSISEPGTVVLYTNPKKEYCKQLLHKLLSIFSIRYEIQRRNPNILDDILKKETTRRLSHIKEEIQQTWLNIGLVVTPSCDYAQKKKIYDRVVQGLMIESRFSEYINQGDAFYISPTIKYDNKNYIIVLNFNYFITSNLDEEESNCNILFKLRRPILAEVQSKLARHINRQGVVSL